MLSEEDQHSYSRVWLPDVIAGHKSEADLLSRNEAWLRSNNVHQQLATRIAAIDPAGRRIQAVHADGQTAWVDYDNLVLAVGADPVVPNLPGPAERELFTLRSVADARRIRAHIAEKQVRSVTIMGGGLLGLELGVALASIELQVNVVELAEYLLPRQLDAAAAAIVRRALESKGLRFFLGEKVAGLCGSDKAEGLILEKSGELRSEMLIVQIGVRPRIDLARAAGLAVGRGIIVNDRLATSQPDIYAIGDCAEHAGRLYGIIPACLEQGRCLGDMLGGKETTYTGTNPRAALKVAGLRVLSLGDVHPDPARAVRSLEHHDGKMTYRRAFLEDGRLISAILLGEFDLPWFLRNLDQPTDAASLEQKITA